MSKKYKAVVENGAIHIETPEFENGAEVEIDISAPISNKTKTLFECLEQIKVIGLPDDFSITHKPKDSME